MIAANDVAGGLVVAGDVVNGPADQFKEVDQCCEKELDWVCVGVHSVEWE